MTLTQRLFKKWIQQHKLTQDQAAKRLGVTQGTISHWLSGRMKPSPESLSRLASVMRVSPKSIRPDLASFLARNGNKRVRRNHR